MQCCFGIADATSIVLFEVFFEMVKGVEVGKVSDVSILAETVNIGYKIVVMAAGMTTSADDQTLFQMWLACLATSLHDDHFICKSDASPAGQGQAGASCSFGEVSYRLQTAAEIVTFGLS